MEASEKITDFFNFGVGERWYGFRKTKCNLLNIIQTTLPLTCYLVNEFAAIFLLSASSSKSGFLRVCRYFCRL